MQAAEEVPGQDEESVDEKKTPHEQEREHEDQESAEELHVLAGDVVLERLAAGGLTG